MSSLTELLTYCETFRHTRYMKCRSVLFSTVWWCCTRGKQKHCRTKLLKRAITIQYLGPRKMANLQCSSIIASGILSHTPSSLMMRVWRVPVAPLINLSVAWKIRRTVHSSEWARSNVTLLHTNYDEKIVRLTSADERMQRFWLNLFLYLATAASISWHRICGSNGLQKHFKTYYGNDLLFSVRDILVYLFSIVITRFDAGISQYVVPVRIRWGKGHGVVSASMST